MFTKLLIMCKLLSSIFFVLIANFTFSQSRLEMDNFQWGNLTKPFKTYSIKVVVNDVVSKNPAIDEVKREIRDNFLFLKKKKLKAGAADFEIRVNITGEVITPEQYVVTSSNSLGRSGDTYTNHKFSVDHLVSSYLTLFINGALQASIKIDSSAVVKRTYSYGEAARSYDWANEYFVMKYQQKDRQEAEESRRKANELTRFEKDFVQVFVNYKKSVSSF